MIRDQEAIWKERGIKYSFDKDSNEWLKYFNWIFTLGSNHCSLGCDYEKNARGRAVVHVEFFLLEKVKQN